MRSNFRLCAITISKHNGIVTFTDAFNLLRCVVFCNSRPTRVPAECVIEKYGKSMPTYSHFPCAICELDYYFLAQRKEILIVKCIEK